MYRREYPDVPGLFDARFSEYNRPSLWREVRSSWVPCLLGLIFMLGGCYLLFWNEGRAVRTSLALEEGLRDVTMPETTAVVFEENNGKLVLVAGLLEVPDALKDPYYGISINAAKLRKVVQVFQWDETVDQKNQNPETASSDPHDHEKTYSYDTDWYDHHIDSSGFYNTLGHHNPHLSDWPANSSLVVNSRVKIGDYLLGTDLKTKFDNFKPFTSDQRPTAEGVRIYAGLYYHSQNVWQPEVGDYRIQFSYAGRAGDEFTAVGKQSGREVRTYTTESGEELLILHEGIRAAWEVFRTEHILNRTTTWMYRLVGWFVLFLGLLCISRLLEMALDEQPWLRRLLALGLTSLPFSVSITTTLIIIGTGWVWYRPIVGVALLTLAVAPYVVPVTRLIIDRRRMNRPERP